MTQNELNEKLGLNKPHNYEIKVCGKKLNWFVGNYWQVLDKLDEVKKGDVFEIKGLGRMKVMYIQLFTKYIQDGSCLLTKRYLVRSDD